MDVSVGIALYDSGGRELRLPAEARLDASTMTFTVGIRSTRMRSPDEVSPDDLDRMANELGLTPRPSLSAAAE